MVRRRSALLFLLAGSSVLFGASAALGEPVPVDRVAVRFTAPELGGPRSPRFVFERVLAFEACVAALEAGERGAFRERHVSSALERHVAETLLSSLRIEPEPGPELISLLEAYEERRAQDRARLDAMMRYAQSAQCRTRLVHDYFEEPYPHDCGHCDNCAAHAEGRAAAGLHR